MPNSSKKNSGKGKGAKAATTDSALPAPQILVAGAVMLLAIAGLLFTSGGGANGGSSRKAGRYGSSNSGGKLHSHKGGRLAAKAADCSVDFMGKAEAADEAGDYAAAVGHFRSQAKCKPTTGSFYNLGFELGELWKSKANRDGPRWFYEARASLRKAIALDGKNKDAQKDLKELLGSRFQGGGGEE